VIGSGGQFMTSEHTLERCRLDPWQQAVSLHGRANGEPNAELYVSIDKRMAEMLAEYHRPVMDEATEASLDDYARKHGLPEEIIRKASE